MTHAPRAKGRGERAWSLGTVPGKGAASILVPTRRAENNIGCRPILSYLTHSHIYICIFRICICICEHLETSIRDQRCKWLGFTRRLYLIVSILSYRILSDLIDRQNNVCLSVSV